LRGYTRKLDLQKPFSHCAFGWLGFFLYIYCTPVV
jgi:hypothetical protein